MTASSIWNRGFLYLEQSMWKGQTCCNQIVYRSAVTDGNGIVPMHRVTEALRIDPKSPPMPVWVQAWIDADAVRPWPPSR